MSFGEHKRRGRIKKDRSPRRKGNGGLPGKKELVIWDSTVELPV